MDNSVKVSFVVAMYNVAAYIEECMRSLCEQTLDDIEIIVVDDCSTDNGRDVVLRTVEEYPKRKGQVRIVSHESNKGITETRKDGLLAAGGEYIHFIDGDDYVDVRMAELMYSKAVEVDADIVICGFWGFGGCYTEGNYYTFPLPEESLTDTDSIRDATLNGFGWPNVWCRMFRRELLLDKRMVWPVASMAEDVIITSAVTLIAKKIAYTTEALYYYRSQPNSIMNNRSAEGILKRFNGFVKNNEVLFSFLEENGVADKYQRGIVEYKVRAKNELFPLFPSFKYRKIWLKTYPEMNRVMFFGNSIFKSTYREKIWFVAQLLGLYPRFSKILLSKRLKPDFICRYNAIK